MSADRSTYNGTCHCSAIGYNFTTAIPPSKWSVRACQCSFCRAHGGYSTSDPEGFLRFVISEPSKLQCYRFALKITDFLICGECGIYIGALMRSSYGMYGVINLRALKTSVQIPEAKPVSYEGESAAQRRARREQSWTPVKGGFF